MVTVFATLPQAKVLTLLGLAAVLAVIAVALLALSAAHDSTAGTTVTATPQSRMTTPALTAHATPGSTAHARYAYRMSLGR